MKKSILIATGIYPPSHGGPATHAKKLFEYFSQKENFNSTDNITDTNKIKNTDNYKTNLFVFEKYNYLPSGVRHMVALFKILKLARASDIIFALDAFSVALPSVIAGKILNKKVFLRIGGDFVHENFVENFELIDMQRFYNKLQDKTLQLNWKLNLKLKVQKCVIENCDGIIFTTKWQRDMYEKFYNIKNKEIEIFTNPFEIKKQEINTDYKNIFLFNTRNVRFKNGDMLRAAFAEAQKVNPEIILDQNNYKLEDLHAKMRESAALINCSISDISPNNVLEGISHGLPVICTRNSGLASQLEPVVRLVDPYDKNDIKNAILELADHDTNLKYRQKIQNYNLQNKSWQELFVEYENLINKICK